MKRLEIDIGRTARAFVLTCFCLLMVVPTIAVQAQTAVPLPPGSGIDAGIQTVTNSVDRLGITSFVTAIVAIIALVLVLLLFVAVYRYGASPLLGIIKDERLARAQDRQDRIDAENRRILAEKELTEYRERQAAAEERRLAAQEAGVKTQERLIAIMDEQENRKESQARTDGAVATIKANTEEAMTAAMSEVKTNLGKIFDELDAIRKRFGDESPSLDDRFAHIEALLKRILEAMPDEAPAPPPVTPVPVVAQNGSTEPQPAPETNP